MVKAITKQQLASVYDVARDILMNQPVGSNIEMIFEKNDVWRRLIIKGDKEYILYSYEKMRTKLSIDGLIVREDIESIPKKGFLSDIENILYYNQRIFEYKEYKDLQTDNIVFFIKKKA